jgi:hypothetical protein
MCFSASASFGASAVLATVGVASIRKVQTPSQLPFAAIPFLFAVQQFAEGLLWIALQDPAHRNWERGSTYIFLFFAQVVWPFLVPLSVLLMEKNRVRKRILFLFMAVGVFISFYLAYCITVFPAQAEIMGIHISYRFNYPFSMGLLSGALYFIPTVLPPFFSSIKRMQLLGLTILISYAATLTFFPHHIISIWCYFAAALSVIVYSIVWALKKQFMIREDRPILYKAE